MMVPACKINISTSTQPQLPPQFGGAFKPHEEMWITFDEVAQVVFDPQRGPPNGQVWCQRNKRGAVIELPREFSMNANLKTDSPFGNVVLEDLQVQPDGQRMKVGESVLNYRLQTDGQMSVAQGQGANGANRLEVELNFCFSCTLHAPGFAPLPPGGAAALAGGGGGGPGGGGGYG